jgi:hypothetical protein
MIKATWMNSFRSFFIILAIAGLINCFFILNTLDSNIYDQKSFHDKRINQKNSSDLNRVLEYQTSIFNQSSGRKNTLGRTDTNSSKDYEFLIVILAIIAIIPEFIVYRLISRRKVYKTKMRNMTTGLVKDVRLRLGYVDINEFRNKLQTGSDISYILSRNYSPRTTNLIISVLGEFKRYQEITQFFFSTEHEVSKKVKEELNKGLPHSEQALKEFVNRYPSSAQRAIEILLNSNTSFSEQAILDFMDKYSSNVKQYSSVTIQGIISILGKSKKYEEIAEFLSSRNILLFQKAQEELKKGLPRSEEALREFINKHPSYADGAIEVLLNSTTSFSEQVIFKFINEYPTYVNKYSPNLLRNIFSFLGKFKQYKEITKLLSSLNPKVSRIAQEQLKSKIKSKRIINCTFCGMEYPFDTDLKRCSNCRTELPIEKLKEKSKEPLKPEKIKKDVTQFVKKQIIPEKYQKDVKKFLFCTNCGTQFPVDTSEEQCNVCNKELPKEKIEQAKKSSLNTEKLKKDVKQFVKKQILPTKFKAETDKFIFCTNCGEKYPINTIHELCFRCKTKLQKERYKISKT